MCFTKYEVFIEISLTVIKLYSEHDFVTERQTDGRTDGRTDRQTGTRGENNISTYPEDRRHNKMQNIPGGKEFNAMHGCL